MKPTFAILFFVLLSGCIVEKSTTYQATLFNHTSHSIKILFYKNGTVNSDDTISLSPDASFRFAYGSVRGNLNGRGFDSNYFGGPNDSIVVYFDAQYSITHYADTPMSLAKHYYMFSSLRNLGNPYSYEYAVLKENGDIINDHKYYFTEQDYLDAKD